MVITFSQLGNNGRLGNQLFQASTTIALALKNNDKYLFPKWKYEPYFNLHDCFTNHFANMETYNEPHFHYAPIPYKLNLNLNGYYQSYKYFEDFQDIIRAKLTPIIKPNIRYNHTSIHIRRGDYLNLTKEYAQLGIDYYQRAMDVIKSKYYVIFSDDIMWCKNNFRGDNIIFSEGKNEVEDMALMVACENHIICNSSFSWWGAYLNTNHSKIIIAPSKWFGPALPHNTKDLLPTEWIKI